MAVPSDSSDPLGAPPRRPLNVPPPVKYSYRKTLTVLYRVFHWSVGVPSVPLLLLAVRGVACCCCSLA
jgi:hypothetical protein